MVCKYRQYKKKNRVELFGVTSKIHTEYMLPEKRRGGGGGGGGK